MRNKTVLSKSLAMLVVSRKQLIDRTLNETPDLFRGFFEFEDNRYALSLIFEREIIWFINSHLYQCNHFINDPDAYSLYKKIILKLMDKFGQSSKMDLDESFIITLFKNKVDLLDGLLEIDKNSMDSVGRVKYLALKDSKIFEREFSRLKEL